MDAPKLHSGDPAPFTRAIVTDLHISDKIADFIKTGGSRTDLPPEFSIQSNYGATNVVDIVRSDDLNRLIQLLEGAACYRRQIESILLNLVQEALQSTMHNCTAVAVRIVTTRLEHQQPSAAGAKSKPVLRRLPCSEGNIMIVMDSEASASQ